jgi:DNA-directed RNA polymerase II subunit RPB1
MTLNSFHTAGATDKNVTGIPRLTELLDASKNPKTPCTTVRLRPVGARCAAVAEYVASTLPLTRLGDVVARCDVVLDPDATAVADDAWMVAAEAALGGAPPPGASRYVVRLELAQEVMRARALTPPMVRRMLRERLEGRASVASSEANAVEWAVRVRLHHVRAMVEAGGLADEQEAILCHRVANVLLDTMVVCGHPDAGAAAAAREERTGEWVVHVQGRMLVDAAASEAVDWARTTSNDVWEVYHALGIEAAAHVLFDQIKAVVSFDGCYVDDRHMLLIVDTMCRGGTLMPLNRHGINRSGASPLMRASFEETTDVLCEAAAFAQEENARGVTTAIMTGQLARVGTGAVRVLLPHRELAPPSTPADAVRVWRSTCRSHRATALAETLECVLDGAPPRRGGAARPASPPFDERPRRVRFRAASPPRGA